MFCGLNVNKSNIWVKKTVKVGNCERFRKG